MLYLSLSNLFRDQNVDPIRFKLVYKGARFYKHAPGDFGWAPLDPSAGYSNQPSIYNSPDQLSSSVRASSKASFACQV